jgi:hypothetical protein
LKSTSLTSRSLIILLTSAADFFSLGMVWRNRELGIVKS